MADPCFVDRRVAFGGHLHQVDAAARRIHLLVPQHVGGAHGQTEAAVHAFVDQLAPTAGGARRSRSQPAGWMLCRCAIRSLPTNRPGFSVPRGSNCCFTLSINENASPPLPHASIAGIAAGSMQHDQRASRVFEFGPQGVQAPGGWQGRSTPPGAASPALFPAPRHSTGRPGNRPGDECGRRSLRPTPAAR